MRLSDIQAKQKPADVSVAFEDEEMTVTYNVHACTSAWWESVASASLNEVLCAVLLEWEILDDEERPLAPSLELLKTLPFDFKNAVLDAIIDDMTGGKAPAGDSDDSSPPTD
jgi:hypothetical protein